MKYLSLLVLFSYCLATADTITLHSTARVKGAVFSLGEIAAVKGNEELAAVELGPTPPPGEIFYCDRAAITAILKSRGFDPSDITWAGASSVEIQTESFTLAHSDIALVAEEFLKLSLPWSETDMSCQLLTAPGQALSLPIPKHSLQIRPSRPEPLKNRGEVAVSVAFIVDGREINQLTLRFRVRVFQIAYVTTAFVKRHTVITSDLVCQKRVEITAISGRAVIAPGQWQGKRARHNLAANHLITIGDLEPVPVVGKGAPVTIVVKSGALKIGVSAIALQDGQVGEVIEVRNCASHKKLKAVVVDKGTVALALEER